MSNTESEGNMDKNCLSEKENELSTRYFFIKLCLLSVVIGAVIFTCSYFGVILYSFWTDKQWVEMAKEHAAAAVGIPLAAVASFFLVSILQVTTGKIEFEGLSFKFRGASGPIVLWIACFIVMVICIRVLWILKEPL